MRYAVSRTIAAERGRSRVVVRVDGPGPVVINAGIPGCGVAYVGRYCPDVNTADPIEFTGE